MKRVADDRTGKKALEINPKSDNLFQNGHDGGDKL